MFVCLVCLVLFSNYRFQEVITGRSLEKTFCPGIFYEREREREKEREKERERTPLIMQKRSREVSLLVFSTSLNTPDFLG